MVAGVVVNARAGLRAPASITARGLNDASTGTACSISTGATAGSRASATRAARAATTGTLASSAAAAGTSVGVRRAGTAQSEQREQGDEECAVQST